MAASESFPDEGASDHCSRSPKREVVADVGQRTLRTLAATAGPCDAVSAQLSAMGLPPDVVDEKRAMFALAAARLLDEGLASDAVAQALWVPGRIEVAGKHTDYAGGRSLLAATTKGFTVVSVHREDAACRIFTSFGHCRERKHVDLRISGDLEPEQGHWSAYPATVIRRLARNFGISRGVDLAVECDLPESSGMSTSSAVICYMWLVLAERNQICEMPRFKQELMSDEDLYSYLGFIENGQDCGKVLVGDKGVGTFGGSEDHTAIMACKEGHLEMFSYCPTKHEASFKFPDDLVFVIAVSGALAEKTGNAMADYNNAAFLARDAAAAWVDANAALPLGGATFVPGRANLAEIVRHVRSTTPGDDAAVRKAIGDAIATRDGHGGKAGYRPGALRGRFEQFFDESEMLVEGIAKSLAAKEFEALGRYSDESHRQTVEVLCNTIPATAWLPQKARVLGALGASAFGAGFGGSCWAVVEEPAASDFMERWRSAYHEEFPRWAESSRFFSMRPGPGAFALW